jgi:uncharacterized membrane protein YedE/YeeE
MSDLVIWSGPVGGALIGLYLVGQYWLTGTPLGCSTGYGNFCAMVARTPYFRTGDYATWNNWRLWFALGLPVGGAVAALTSGVVPEPTLSMGALYDSVVPASVLGRGAYLVGGGALIGFGARMAGGCQSGHSINGMSLLNLPSLVASVGFFIGGIVAVQALFRWLR